MSQILTMPTAAPRLGLLRAITIIALVTLPFMTALTIKVGFPLKIYEVALLAAMVLAPFAGRLSFPRRAIPGIILTAIWMGLAGAILIFRLAFPLDTVQVAGFDSRFGPVGDGVTKFIYLLLDLFAFIVFARFAAREEKNFIKYWLIGASLAASYSCYLFLMNMIGIELPPLLPGANTAQIGLAGRLFIRCATFREGNEAGLYFAISSLLAFHGGYRKTALYLASAIITTFSTLAMIILLGMAVRQFWHYVIKLSPRIRLLLLPFILAIGIGMAAVLAATAIFQSVVVNKLTSANGPDALSRVERLVFAKAAWDMFVDHPVLGVGVAQFGYNFASYSPYPITTKPIPNVVYLEFLSEDGIVVFAIFSIFYFKALKRTKGKGRVYLRLAMASLTLSFFAYTTISVMFIWALFGLIFGRRETEDPQEAGDPPLCQPV